MQAWQKWIVLQQCKNILPSYKPVDAKNKSSFKIHPLEN